MPPGAHGGTLRGVRQLRLGVGPVLRTLQPLHVRVVQGQKHDNPEDSLCDALNHTFDDFIGEDLRGDAGDVNPAEDADAARADGQNALADRRRPHCGPHKAVH